jgi:hypothetical protein
MFVGLEHFGPAQMRTRAFVERHKGKPFVFLGVNTDDGEAARRVAAKEGTTWPSFAEEGVIRYCNDTLQRTSARSGPDGKPISVRRPDEVVEDLLKERMYHADPEHLWNRLHRALFVRVGPDGRTYGQDRLEPLLWVGSKHLLEGKAHQRAVAILDEFLKNKGEKLIEDPLKRAVLQRDLWLIFNWLDDVHSHFYDPELTSDEVRAAQDRLRPRLAAVIGRLALTRDQIKQLPDNYAMAVASADYARRFDPKHPDTPYLPADLFDSNGPWVCVGRPDGPVAPQHQADTGTNMFTNSAFLVFLRLPDGRAATLDFLKRLRTFDQPLRVDAKEPKIGMQYLPNPELPQFPVGTQVALVRRSLLIAVPNTLLATTLTESVQLRFYREVPQMTEPNVRAAIESSGGGRVADPRIAAWQAFHEFQLRRSRLFANRAGGLRAVGSDERDFNLPFFLQMRDEFEDPDYRASGGSRPPARSFSESQHVVKQDCFLCHSLPGAASFNSYFNFRGNGSLVNRGDVTRPFSLSEMSVSEVDAATVRWKEGRPHWIALRKLLASAK